MRNGDCDRCGGTGLVKRDEGDKIGLFGPGICPKCDGTGGKYGNKAGVSVEKKPEPPAGPQGDYFPGYY